MDFPEIPNLARVPGEDQDDPIYLATGNDGREAGRAIGISLLGVDPVGPATFFPAGADFRQSWQAWLNERFENNLGPIFSQIYLATGEMRNRSISRLDWKIDQVLKPGESERSLNAATALFDGTTEVRRLPQWVKFLQNMDQGETPGHATSLFALRAALFHLPLLPALVSYTFFEWKSAALAESLLPAKELTPSTFGTRFPESIDAVKRVFESEAGDAIKISSV